MFLRIDWVPFAAAVLAWPVAQDCIDASNLGTPTGILAVVFAAADPLHSDQSAQTDSSDWQYSDIPGSRSCGSGLPAAPAAHKPLHAPLSKLRSFHLPVLHQTTTTPAGWREPPPCYRRASLLRSLGMSR